MRAKDLTGQRFNRLVVLEYAGQIRFSGSGKTKRKWLCKCDCGATTIVTGNSLVTGSTKSCGCLASEMQSENGKKRRKHGMTNSRLYGIWRGMKRRCNDPKVKAYPNYGGRGIKICAEWEADFETFKNWAYANGYEENLTIERKDVNKGYCPENCKWATKLEQARNKRNSVRTYDVFGNERSIRDVVDGKKVSYSAIEDRLRKGWDIEAAIKIPKLTNKDRSKHVEQLSIETGEVIREYESVKEACREGGISYKALTRRCKEGGGEFKGYMWKYKEKLNIKIQYLADIDKIEWNPKGDMVDLRCAEDVVMKKGEYKLIPLGVAMELPEGYFAEVLPRSSTFGKYKILMANSVGVIDHTYRGKTDMWYFPAYAMEDTKIEKNTRICQFVLLEQIPEIEFVTVDVLENESRNGFGSTGEK